MFTSCHCTTAAVLVGVLVSLPSALADASMDPCTCYTHAWCQLIRAPVPRRMDENDDSLAWHVCFESHIVCMAAMTCLNRIAC